MTEINYARRTIPHIFIAGIDCTKEIEEYLISLQLTDVMEDEADDLQITLYDKNSIFSGSWFGANSSKGNSAAANAAQSEYSESEIVYTATPKSGLPVKSAPDNKAEKIGMLSYGEEADVIEITDGWAKIKYNEAEAFCYANLLKKTEKKAVLTSLGGRSIGDKVIVNGRTHQNPLGDELKKIHADKEINYTTVYQGSTLVDYEGTITHISKRANDPYPIYIDRLGWVSLGDITGLGEEKALSIPSGFRKGTRIDLMIEQKNTDGKGNNKIQSYEDFELDSISASSPSTFTVKATSLPHTSTVRETKKNRVFENKSNSEILAEIAGECSMKYFYDSGYNPMHERLEQTDCSDIAFLKWLAGRCGLALKSTSNMLIMFDEAAYEARDIYRKIYKSDCESWNFKTGFDDVAYTSCHVLYTLENGETIEYTYTPRSTEKGSRETAKKSDSGTTKYSFDTSSAKKANSKTPIPVSSSSALNNGSGEVLEITNERVNSREEARQLAMKRLREKNKNEFSASVTLPGDCYLCGGLTVELSEEFGGWSGKYIIEKATHNISSGGYTTKIDMYRPLDGF